MTILFLALWLQMSAPTQTFKVTDARPNDHGKVVSTQIACIKTYADGFIEYNPCEISTEPPTTNFIKPAVQYNEFDLAAQRAADETDGKPPISAGEPIRYCLDNEIINIEGKELATCEKGQWVTSDWMKRAAEPVDVPAVRHEDNRRFYCGIGGVSRCDHGEFLPKRNSGLMCGYDAAAKKLEASCGKATYTCADKSRVLLTSEDGKKHCIKF